MKSNNTKEKAPKTEATKTKLDRELIKKLHKILNNLINDPESGEFRKPVYYKALGLEDYKKIIKKPMDLNSVRRNLNKNSYEFLEEILDDIQLVWNNCKLYNEQGSWIYLTAVKLETFFHDQCLEQFPSTPLPSNKIPDRALLLQQYNEKSSKQKQSLSAKDQSNEEEQKGTSNILPLPKLANQSSNTSTSNPQTIAQSLITAFSEVSQNKQSQSGNITIQASLSANNQQKATNIGLPFKFTKKGIKRISQKQVVHIPFMKFANDKQKFDQLIQTTKTVSKLLTNQQKQIIDIIQEFQPSIIQTDEKEVKNVDFNQVSEYTYELITSYLNLLKNQESSEQIMEIESDEENNIEILNNQQSNNLSLNI
ncbi:hypothetical protein ABPG72_008811 [Tetrahymena utriculariae]